MDHFHFERQALLNALGRTAVCYSAASSCFEGPVSLALAEHAGVRNDYRRRLADEWQLDWGDPEAADIDNAERCAQSGLAAVAELVASLEFALSGLLKELPVEALDIEIRNQLLADSAHLRAKVRDEQVKLRANIQERRAPKSESLGEARQFEVFFATNRKPILGGGKLIGFSGERSDHVQYGSCEVTIPETHRIGSIGSPWWHRIVRGDDRLRLSSIAELEADRYWAAISDRLHIEAEPGDAVVFIHGYNVSFLEAALRAAQIGADLAIGGVVAFFSWPSRGTVLGYMADEAAIEASEPQIARFLIDIAERSGARAVHIIAHSMGNRGLLRAVDRIAARAAASTGKPFDQIVLAAPDVDTGIFRSLASAYGSVAKRTTLYVSSADLAVRGSRLLHGAPRIGFVPPIAVIPGIDTINAANVDVTLLGHGYIANARSLIVDIYELMKTGRTPENRATLRRRAAEDGQVYWEFAS